MHRLHALLLALWLSGCSRRERVLPPGGEDTAVPAASIGEHIERYATWIGGVAGALLCLLPILFVVAGVFKIPGIREHIGKLALALLGTALTAGVVSLFGHYYLWFVVPVFAVLLVAIGLYAWKNRARAEPLLGIDLNGDSVLGVRDDGGSERRNTGADG